MSEIYGVTAAGFIPKRLPDIISDMEQGFKSAFGADIDTSADCVIGQEIGVLSKPAADVWEELAIVAAGKNINGATGAMLEDLAFFRGINRRGATKATSRVALYKKFASAAVTVPAGSKVRAPGLEGAPVFQLKESCNIVPEEIVSVLFIVTVTPASGQVFSYTLANLDGSIAKVVSYKAIADDTAVAVADYLAAITATDTRFKVERLEGEKILITAAADVFEFKVFGVVAVVLDEIATAANFQAVEDGTNNGGANAISEIVTPVSGWLRCGNLFDIRPGAGIETDTELRLEVLNAFSSAPAGTVDAVRNAVRKVPGVSFCNVAENDSSQWRGVMPPNSLAIVADGEIGIDAGIGAAILASKPGGTETVGTITVATTDEVGNSRSVKYSRPDYTPAAVKITATQNPDAARQNDWKEKMKAAAVAIGSAYPMGVDMPAAAFFAAVYSVKGIGTATVEIGKGTAPVYTAGLLVVAPFEKLQFDAARVIVEG